MTVMPSYHPDLQTFLIPLAERGMTLRDALAKLEAIGNKASEVPWIVRLMENPCFSFTPFSMFKGRVSLFQHDCIHLLLGRGTSLMDEAFTIGFTMGSSHAMSTTASKVFGYVAGHWYPKAYRFPVHAHKVYADAVHLGMISNCQPLEEIDYRPYLDQSLKQVREELGMEVDLLDSYYRLEAARNPHVEASQRFCT
ncbi:MAG: hypothetical protein ABGY95_02635 [Rubritalea sp.]|uniref:hypothetical protein n=1 Tax=Rubritalea sp. TaxID=2109375 RepID=UPI003242A721